jgi:hypothetical protein
MSEQEKFPNIYFPALMSLKLNPMKKIIPDTLILVVPVQKLLIEIDFS